jgi:hypothetical protein
MIARPLLLAGLACAGFARVCAGDTPPLPTSIATSTSDLFPQVTCTSANTAACVDVLQLAADTRESLAPLLNLGPAWRFPVHIHVLTPDDPLTAKIDREASQVFAQGDTMRIEAVVPLDDPNAREFVQRQYVVALLWERFFAKTTKFDGGTHLDVVPLWLVEGLREWLNKDPAHNRESIALRALQNQSAPSLQEVTGWHELSGDYLLGLWQRAFSYYLVDSLTREGARRDDFQTWLNSFSSPDEAGQLHFPTEANWRQELADAAARGRSLVYSWQETSDELAANGTITYAASKTSPVKTCTIDTIAALPRSSALVQAAQERLDILTALELRAHPAWQPVFEAYRAALTALVLNNRAHPAAKLFARASRLRQDEAAEHQKLVDYLNWFEVTRDFGETGSRFSVYFDTAKEMERVEADPAHPNPIRASLLQIESEL